MKNSEKILNEIDDHIHLVYEDILYILRLLTAFIFIVMGAIGIILPIIPDWPLFLIGIVLLDTHGIFRKKILNKTPEKYKKIMKKILFFIKIKDERKGAHG